MNTRSKALPRVSSNIVCKSLTRNGQTQCFSFITIADLAYMAKRNMHRVEQSFDLIIGIPRSGMIPACMLALYKNTPVTDLESFLRNQPPGQGDTRAIQLSFSRPLDVRSILLVDDSVDTGQSLIQAVAYMLKNWAALTRYLENGDLPIDNNRTERSLRGLAIGRNNWPFLGSYRGGKTTAILRIFVSSCELLEIDPFEWFRDVLSRIPAHSIQQIDQLIPHAWVAARS